MNKNRTAGLILNTGKEAAFPLAEKVLNWFDEHKINYLLEKSAANRFNNINGVDYQKLRQSADYIILFGGDGTFLHTAHHFIGTDIPLLGINIGGLGFLTEIETNEIIQALTSVYENKYEIEKRMLLDCRIFREAKQVSRTRALNDFAVNRAAAASTINIKIYIDGEFVNSYRGDGVIISTPTGSTAYSLSAGGPIINPVVRAVLITPVCPHTLNVRPIVISEQEEIKLELEGEDEKMTAVSDGHYSHSLKADDSIVISAAKEEVSLIKLAGRNFYNILHKKLGTGLV